MSRDRDVMFASLPGGQAHVTSNLARVIIAMPFEQSRKFFAAKSRGILIL